MVSKIVATENLLLHHIRQIARLREREDISDSQLRAGVYLQLYAMRKSISFDVPALGTAPFDVSFVDAIARKVPPKSYQIAFADSVQTHSSHIAVLDGIKARATTVDAQKVATVRQPQLLLFRSPGFMARTAGKQLSDDATRIYVALRPSHADAFLTHLYESLAAGIEHFSMKALANPVSYSRYDAGVVYITRNNLSLALRRIEEWAVQLRVKLRRRCPLGTCAIVPGIAWADGIAASEEGRTSYGQWLSALLFDAADEYGSSITSTQLRDAVAARGRRSNEIWSALP